MSTSNEVKKSVQNTVTSVSEYVINNLAKAKTSGQLDIEIKQLEQVITIVKECSKAGYSLAERTLDRELRNILGE